MRVYQRGNKWWFDGVVDGERQRFALEASIRTADQAEEWLFKYKADSDALSLRRFISDYVQERRTQLSPDTIRSYKLSLRIFESHFGVERKINTITGREISIWAVSLIDSGLKPESVNIHLRNIKAAFNRALIWELISRVPHIEMVKTPKRLPRHLTEAEFESLLAHEADSDFRRLWQFMVWTGVRRGEALGLCWEHVSFGERPQALVTGKGDKQRMVPLLPPAVAALGRPGEAGPVFQLGGRDYISHRFLKAARAAGLKAKLHNLRHTALTWMVAHNVPVKLVQDIAGHVDINTTLGYAKTFAGGAYDTLARAFNFE